MTKGSFSTISEKCLEDWTDIGVYDIKSVFGW